MEITQQTGETLVSSPSRVKQVTSKGHIRGSSLLLFGRFISMAINLVGQILTVRYLSKEDYGAFAYAVSIASLCSTAAVFGLDKAVARFVPIYQERKEYDKMFGSIVMMLVTIAGFGIALILLTFGFQNLIAQNYIQDKQALALLLILISLAPIDALDSLFEGMFAVFTSPKAIFARKHILGPTLKLFAVIVLVVGGDIHDYTLWYVIGATIGMGAYAVMMVGVLRQQGLFAYFNYKTMKMPFREIFGFSIPLLSSDLVYVLRSYLPVLLLEYFHSSVGVAAFRAVLPVARLNMLVYQSFTFLYMPMASRMFARNERKGINELYWQSAIWIAIISFPVFVASFSLAQPLTVLMFGGRYADSGLILALLSLGHYVNAALGFNTFTLRVYGKVRYIILQDLLSVIAGVASSFWLIPRYGALGAAISTSITLIAQNAFCQLGLLFGTDVKAFDLAYLPAYMSIALGGFGLFLIQWLVAPPLYISFPLAMLVSLLVLGVNRKTLKIEQVFPELMRWPLLKKLLDSSSKSASHSLS